MLQGVLAYPLGAEGTLTRVLEAGSGDRAVVFVHGLGARADRWARNLTAVAEAGYRAIAIDLPGHGFAAKDGSYPHGAQGYARFVASVIRTLELDRPAIVGTSLGGHVAATVACQNPGAIRGLMLVGSTGLFPIGEAARARLAGRARDRSVAGIESKLKAVLYDPALVTQSLITEEYRINNSPGSDGVFAVLARYFAEAIDDDVVGECLAALLPRPPLELVWGEHDRSVPLEVGRAAAQLLSPAPLYVIAESAHAPYFEKPDEFNPCLMSFLGRLPWSASHPQTVQES